MVQNKFENSMREQLEARKLPTPQNGWHELQGRLDKHDTQKKYKKWLMYVGIAASVVGVALVSFFMFKSNTTHHIVTDVQSVENPKVEQMPTTSKMKVEELNTVENIKGNRSLVVTETKPKEHIEVANPAQNKIAKDKKVLQNTTAENLEANGIASGNTIVSEASFQESEQITDAYLEDLLEEANQDLQIQQQGIKRAKQTVNAEVLLEGVENDIEHSFREKVFDVVKKGFGKVKTAVVERNK
ncbi:hypothetical protein [Formosa sp. A9]|uniref:hypothetical protein n=1 Tax=Formosa sp. A9 TaxID=3442641 RepID=UPI003EB99C09